jgi:hypothetical protein
MSAQIVKELSSEASGLMLAILQRHAFRHHAAAFVLGHGLQHLDGLADMRVHTRKIQQHLDRLGEIEDMYVDLCGRPTGAEDLADAIRPKLESLPYPETRIDLACALSITGRGERAAARSYVECHYAPFAALAQATLADETSDTTDEDLLVEYCSSETHRATAQEYWQRWTVLSLHSLGRIDNQADQRTVELSLRDKPVAAVIEAFLDEIEPLRQSTGLELPTLRDIGSDLPEALRGRFRTE